MKSVLITGASRGLGKALLEEFWQCGYNVYPLIRKVDDKEKLDANYKSRCFPILSDVAAEECGDQINKVVSAHTGVLDIVINNAGIPGKGHQIETVSLDEILQGFKVHCLGALNVSKAALPFLRKSELGKIINISSRLGSLSKMASGEFKNRKFSYSYRLAKAAQNMLTVCLNNELSGSNIGVLAIHPGLIKTDSGASDAYETPEDAAKRLRKWIEDVSNEDFGTYQNPGYGEFPW